MALGGDLPSPVRFLTRLLGWGLGLLMMILIVTRIAGGGLAGHVVACSEGAPGVARAADALAATQAFAACLERRSGFFERMALAPTLKMLRALPHAPCRFVGRWKSSKTAAGYEIALNGDGSFGARPWGARDGGETARGAWGVHDGRMVWLYDEGVQWPPDVNRIEIRGEHAFTLTEANGSKTDFLRFDALPPGACRPGL